MRVTLGKDAVCQFPVSAVTDFALGEESDVIRVEFGEGGASGEGGATAALEIDLGARDQGRSRREAFALWTAMRKQSRIGSARPAAQLVYSMIEQPLNGFDSPMNVRFASADAAYEVFKNCLDDRRWRFLCLRIYQADLVSFDGRSANHGHGEYKSVVTVRRYGTDFVTPPELYHMPWVTVQTLQRGDDSLVAEAFTSFDDGLARFRAREGDLSLKVLRLFIESLGSYVCAGDGSVQHTPVNPICAGEIKRVY
jgi:hypothetical protein